MKYHQVILRATHVKFCEDVLEYVHGDREMDS
jgi:hypothetical protein